MFEAGAIAFRLQMVGAQVFQQEANASEKALDKLGTTAAASGQKAAKGGQGVDELGKKAKAAKPALDDAAKGTKTVGDEADKADPKVKKVSKSVEQLRAETNQARNTVGTAFLGIGAAIAAAATIAVAKFANFDDGMSNVRASTHATAEDMSLLSEAALDAGADTAYSAREAADAQDELAKAGISVSDILGGSLRGSLSLAAAGELEVARAAEIAATTLKVFNLEGDQTEHVADLLAAAAGKAQGGVGDIALALEYAGIGLAQFNVPLEESVGTLALFAANGILGEKAGTGLRGALASLVGPSAIGARTMQYYGVQVFDAQGKFIGLAGVAQTLQDAFKDLSEEERSEAMNRIFGNESMNVANVLYKSGAAGVKEWTGLVNESGYAALTAGIRQDNLAGDVEKLGGAFDTALVKTGSTANDVLRDMVQIVTYLIDSYSSWDPAVQGTALALGVGTAAVLLLGGTALLTVNKLAEFKLALKTLETSMGGVATKGGIAVLAITAIVAVLAAVAGANADAAARTEAYGDTLDKTTKAVTNSTRELAKMNLSKAGDFWAQMINQGGSAYDAATKLGIGLDTVTDAALGNADALELVLEQTAMTEEAFRASGLRYGDYQAAVNKVKIAVQGESSSLEEAIRVAEQKESVDEKAIDILGNSADAYGEVDDKVDGVVSSIKDLAAELDALNSRNLDASAAAIALEAAYDDFDATLKKNGQTLDITNEKGRENRAALNEIAEAALKSGQSITDAGGGYEAYRESMEASRAALLERIADLGLSGDAAQNLADEILKIPSQTEWRVYADTTNADRALERFTSKWQGQTINLTATGSGKLGSGILGKADGGVVQYYANGGRYEHHVAQIAAAGTMRVWAEPETGGEAYIPLALSKRARSNQVMTETASLLGGTYIPGGTQSFAEGGTTTRAAARAGSGARIEGTLELIGGKAFVKGVIVEHELDEALEFSSGGSAH